MEYIHVIYIQLTEQEGQSTTTKPYGILLHNFLQRVSASLKRANTQTHNIKIYPFLSLYQTTSAQNTQGDQKVSVHLMITIQKVTSNVQTVPRQFPDVY
jgi:hypothetical protein